MALTMKAKTTPTGYLAVVKTPDGEYEYPVARFDDDGYALICDLFTGKLVRAADHPEFEHVIPMWQVSR